MSSEDESQRITEDILKESLAKKLQVHPHDVEIKDFQVSDGIKKGENFSCIMKAVKVNSLVRGAENQSEFMTKVMPMNQWRQKWLQEVIVKFYLPKCILYWSILQESVPISQFQAVFFRTEVDFYTKLKPKLDRLASDPGIASVQVPVCYYADEDKGVIVMENLVNEGYKNMDKKDGLDVPHVKTVLEQLARFHGLSYHLMNSYFGGTKRFLKVSWELS